MVKYMVVNAPSSYNLLLGCPSRSGVINIEYEDEVPHDRREGGHHEGRSKGGPKVLRNQLVQPERVIRPPINLVN